MNSQKLTHLLIPKVFLISTSKLDSERLSACSCPDSSGSPVCDQCLPHYSGPQCDECSAGFFRSPVGCVRCDCSGNADPQGPIQLCHPKTGHCFHCINNTSGPQCQLCAPGFVGNATAHNCTRPSKLLCVRWFVFGFVFLRSFFLFGVSEVKRPSPRGGRKSLGKKRNGLCGGHGTTPRKNLKVHHQLQ